MNSNEQIKFLTEYITASDTRASFDGRSVRFLFNEIDKENIKAVCDEIQLTHEFHLNSQCEIRIDKLWSNETLLIFFNDEDFFKRGLNSLDKFNELHLIILFHENKILQKNSNESFTIEKAILFNFYNYHQILSFLEKQEHFMSVHSRPDLQFVIFSSEKGPFHIGYNLHELRVKNLEDLGVLYKTLTTEMQKIDFVQFFKSAVMQAVHEYAVTERFYYLVHSLRVIISVAQRDHYIYIRNFDFEKIKSKFKEERNKYLESIEKNIESVNKQVTSFPLTFAASAFAGFQVKDKPFILILIAGAYCVYTIIAYRVLNISTYNIEGIKSDVDNESDKLKKGYEIIYEDFNADFTRIYTKVDKTNSLISILKSVLVALLISFLAFAFYEMFFVNHDIITPK